MVIISKQSWLQVFILNKDNLLLLNSFLYSYLMVIIFKIAQSVGTLEYIDCISAEG